MYKYKSTSIYNSCVKYNILKILPKYSNETHLLKCAPHLPINQIFSVAFLVVFFFLL